MLKTPENASNWRKLDISSVYAIIEGRSSIVLFGDFIMKKNRKSTVKKNLGSHIVRIMLLACAAMAYSAVLSNLIDRSAGEIVVSAWNDEAVEQLRLVSTEAEAEPADAMLLDQKYPMQYLNTASDLLESNEMLSAALQTMDKRTPVYVMENDGTLAHIMLQDSTVGYVRSAALSDSLSVIFDDCSETKYISGDAVLKSDPWGDAADAASVTLNDEVTLTGTNDETYWRVSYDGMTAYVDRDVLMDEKYVEPEPEPEPEPVRTEPQANPEWDGSVLTRSAGVVYGPSGKETYYNLNMSGVVAILQGMGVSGEYWVRSDGVKMYGDYIIAACAFDIRPRGSTVETSLGTAICADTGGFAANNPTQVDIAVDW